MLITNLFVIDQCSKRKYSRRVTLLVMGLFIAVIVAAAYLVVSQIPGFGNGNGLFVFLGFTFAIPVKILYRTSAAKIISLACTSWVYTFFIFAISIQASYLVDAIPQNVTSLIVQTLLYLITFLWFFKLLKYKFFPMLSQLTTNETKSLMWMSIIWFWTAFVINLAFVYPEFYILRVLATISAGICALNFYRYIYRVVDSDRAMRSLEKIAYHDALTQLRGRALLTSDINQLIDRGISFSLVFFDLNNFKSINDTYGHTVGDEYLSFFAQEAKERIGSDGGFYRLAGDEFVGLLTETDITEFLESFESIPPQINEEGIPYLGVSYGVAVYPDDGKTLNSLLDLADQEMYKMKKKHKAKMREMNA